PAVIYKLQFTDNSGIPITKTGKQKLQITMPVPEGFAEKSVQVYLTDRNGQLEAVNAEYVKMDGINCLRFVLSYVSDICITKADVPFQESEVLEETNTIVHLSQAPQQSKGGVPYHWILGGILILAGILCIGYQKIEK
ncbi:MAG: hypothetical protein IJF07_06225, partial [Lachnospiraceae bacterium]|nr:hypothetical protein [Lachnospiraceae bacterium]